MLPSLYYLAPVLGGYVATSYYLLKNPHILHKRKRLAFHCRHISHRGGAGERIENTLGAFDNAVSCQTDLLELDCHMTKDGRVVVSHDLNLLRQTGHDVNICDLTYEELPPYKETLEVTFFPGHFSSGSDRRIPLLEEVFQRHPDMPINVEIKEDDRDVIRKVSDMVRRYQRSDRTIWASVNDKVMKKCQAENTDMPVIFTPRRGLVLLLLYYTGLLPFVPLRECVVETVMPSLINRTYLPENKLMRNPFLAYLQEKLIMRKSLLQHLQDRGIQVYFWVLNQDSDFQKALDLGASGLMTDYPCKLQAFLRQHGGTQRERGGTQREGGGTQREGGGTQREGGGTQREGGGTQREGGGTQREGGGTQQEGGGTQREGGGTQRERGRTQREGGGTQREGGGTQREGGGTQREGGGTQREGGGTQQEGGGTQREGGGVDTTHTEAQRTEVTPAAE